MRLVLKLGGRVATETIGQAHELYESGHEVVVVHGAGPQISAELERHGLPVRFAAGRRVTDAATLAVVRASLQVVGAELAAALGPDARHLMGDEIGLTATPLPGLGLVGEPHAGRLPAVEDALADGLIAVVTPIAVGPLNVNADEAASAIASGIGAERVVFLSDVPGVYVDGSVVTELYADDADELLASGAFDGGIVPKLLAAVVAARAGIRTEIGATEVRA